MGDRFLVGVAPQCIFSRQMAIPNGASMITSTLEMDGKDVRDFSTLVLIPALFALANALMKTPAPAGREAVIQDFLVQRVDKAVVARHTAIRPFLVFPEP